MTRRLGDWFVWLTLGAVAFLAVQALSGCGAGAIAAHARASSIVTVALAGADDLAEHGAEVAMAACTDEACTLDVEHATAVIDAAIGTAVAAATAYVQAVELAEVGGEDGDVLAALLVALVRLLRAWSELAGLYAPLGVTLPQLPTSVLALGGAA